MGNITFRPVWLTARPVELSVADLRGYIAWLGHNMGRMAPPDREVAKRIRYALDVERKQRHQARKLKSRQGRHPTGKQVKRGRA